MKKFAVDLAWYTREIQTAYVEIEAENEEEALEKVEDLVLDDPENLIRWGKSEIVDGEHEVGAVREIAQ